MKGLDLAIRVERAVLDEKKFNFLYEDENNCHFMDQTNFEQIAINKSLLGEKNKLLKENMAVKFIFMKIKLYRLIYHLLSN